jgi:hypothetical protein
LAEHRHGRLAPRAVDVEREAQMGEVAALAVLAARRETFGEASCRR